MTLEFVDATRQQAKARIAIQGPAGSGKTFTALRIAARWGGTTGLMDTEHGSALKYAAVPGQEPGLGRWTFKHLPVRAFSPTILTEGLAAAASTHIDNLIIDSFTHFWSGNEGLLEQVEKASVKTGGNTFGGWKTVRPIERRMLDALLSYPGHIIVTMRSKTEYAIEEDARGRKVPRKIGLKADQREGLDYEFDVVGEMDFDRQLTITKTRCVALSGAVIDHPGEAFADQISEWLAEGDAMVDANGLRAAAIEAQDDVAQLRIIYGTCNRLGLLTASVMGLDGQPTALGALIRSLGQKEA